MLIAHLSDLHITAPGRKAYGKVPTGDNLARCVKHINNLVPQPDLVLVTGDITFDAQVEETALAGRLLSDLRIPWYVVPGNHDNPDTLKVLQQGWRRAPVIREGSSGFDYFLPDSAISLLGIDSSTPDSPGGKVSKAQVQWIHRRLVENRDKPVILFLHHPPVRCGVLETDEDGFEGADLLGEVVERFSTIIRILCGHIHLASHVNWRGTIVSTAPSMGL
ncbi:MAG TPA: hypothetical protein ENK89_00795, partial [Desulfobulbaceae bacterium]|nr:hypothetical protein [Desulfobulbaceae bacterium]